MHEKDPLHVARGRVAAASPRGLKPDPQALDEARQDLAVAKIARYVRRTLEAAPPLSAERGARLAAVLGGSGR